MIRRLCFTLLAAVCCLSCSKKEDFFYSTTYPVTAIEARASVGEGASEELTALVEQLKEEVVATAPVKAGGRYRLDFNRYDGGMLTVHPSEKGEAVKGSFTKQPAASTMDFSYGEENYTVRSVGYTDEAGELCIRFEVDLTAAYKELYQIEDERFELIRVELTSHLYE